MLCPRVSVGIHLLRVALDEFLEQSLMMQTHLLADRRLPVYTVY